MRSIAIALSLTLLALGSAWAAEPSAVIDEAVRSVHERKAAAASQLIVLEGGDKAAFDKLFDEYQSGLEALNKEYASLAYRLLEKSSVPSVDEVKKMIREFRDLDVKKLDLREYYFEKFGTTLDATQLIRLLQLENKADAILKHGAAMQIPFLE